MKCATKECELLNDINRLKYFYANLMAYTSKMFILNIFMWFTG